MLYQVRQRCTKGLAASVAVDAGRDDDGHRDDAAGLARD
jgi:hypothetical protein